MDPAPAGKETYYELSEPLLRICYEVKENQGGPVKLFIDFLGNLYSAREIKKKYMQFNLGRSKFYLGEIDEGVANLFKAQKLEKIDLIATSNIFSLFLEKENVEKAKAALEKVLNDHPDNYVFIETVADVYFNSNYFEKALPLYEKVIAAKPGDFLIPFQLAACHAATNYLPLVLSNLEKALELLPAQQDDFADLILSVYLNTLLKNIFIHVTLNNIPGFLRETLTIAEKFSRKDAFLKAIPGVIFTLLRRYETLEAGRWERLETLLNGVFKDEQDMVVPLKFLNIGLRYLLKKEKNVLLQFTKEERQTFKKIVLDLMPQPKSERLSAHVG